MSSRWRNHGALLLLALVATCVRAQVTVIWTGATNSSFENASNWQGGVAPAAGDHLALGPAANQSIVLGASATVGNITLNGTGTFYSLYPTIPANELTLNGNIATSAGSSHYLVIGAQVILGAGNHNYAVDGATVYQPVAVGGTGGITKTGSGELHLGATGNFSGGTVVSGGSLLVGDDGALGSGSVTVNGGTLGVSFLFDGESSSIRLANNFLLGSNPVFAGSSSLGISLILGDSELETTLAPLSGVTAVSFHLDDDEPLYIDGALVDGEDPTSYSFNDKTYVLSGANAYTGATYSNDARIIYAYESSLSGLVSASIGASADGYVGLAEATPTSVATFLSKLDPSAFYGTVGFDNYLDYAGPINLSAFPSGVALGTNSNATLFGQITPPSGATAYRFTGHGWMYLADENLQPSYKLTGTSGLSVSSAPDDAPPFVLVLSRSATNDYTGATTVGHAGLIFDSAGARSTASAYTLNAGAYLGATENAGFTVAGFVSAFDSFTYAPTSVLGFDASGIINGVNNTPLTVANLNLSSLDTPVYVGSASHAILSGAHTTTGEGTNDYYFTGFDGGFLQVDSNLAGASRKVYAGRPDIYQSEDTSHGIVALMDTGNSYGGGTVLNSGRIYAPSASALGTGTLTAQPQTTDGKVYLQTIGTFAPSVVLDGGELRLDQVGTLTFSGVVSGTGKLVLDGVGTLHLSGNNTYSGGSFFLDRGSIYVDSNTGLGTGRLETDEGADVYFTTSAPTIGGLDGGYAYDDDGIDYSDLHLAGGSTLTINQGGYGYFQGTILEGASPAAIVKTGPGELTLHPSVASTYSGGTTILQGRLVAGNVSSLGSGAITINGGTLGLGGNFVLPNLINFGASGGMLGGSGTISSAITAGTNVVIAPGDSPGTLTFTNGLTLAPGGTLDLEVQYATGAAGTGYDLVHVSAGLLDITATTGTPFTLNLISLSTGGSPGNVADFDPNLSHTWNFALANGGIANFSADKFNLVTTAFTNPLNNGFFTLSTGGVVGNQVLQLNFTPVPEPSTYALLAAGLGWVYLRRRRRTA